MCVFAEPFLATAVSAGLTILAFSGYVTITFRNKSKLNSKNICCNVLRQNLLSSHLLSDNLKIKQAKTYFSPPRYFTYTRMSRRGLHDASDHVLMRLCEHEEEEAAGTWRQLCNNFFCSK
jgi:hypothetical protein